MNSLFLPTDLKPYFGFDAINPDGNFSVLADGTSLSSIYDMNQGISTVSQASGVAQITYETNELNGQPCFGFNGSQWANCASNSTNEINGAITIIAAFKLTNVTGTKRLVGKLLTSMFSFVDAKYTFTTWNGATGTSSTSTADQITADVWQFATFLYKPSWTTDFYKNGAFIENVANAANTVSASDFYFGSRDGTQHFFNGKCAFAYGYPRALEAWELNQLQFYYRVRTNIT
jgi:hypothetical protein